MPALCGHQDGLTGSRIEGNLSVVKTTIDIPEPLYKQAKIRAVERGQTLRVLMLSALERELGNAGSLPAERPKTFAERRRLLPEFVRASNAGLLRPASGERDVTALISEDRDAR